MSFHYKQFDLFGKMINNKNFYIFNNTSEEDKIEIASKLEKFETGSDFFKYYTNKDIYYMFELIEKTNLFFSDINHELNFKSKIDIYISCLTNIYLISIFISKNRIILNKAISDIKKNLDNFYSENQTDTNIQKKINNYISGLLGTTIKKSKKRNPQVLFNVNTFTKSDNVKTDSPNICILNNKSSNVSTEIKIIDHSMNNSYLNQEKTHDITNYTNNYYNNYYFNNDEEHIIFDLTTPQFPNKIIEDNINNTNNKEPNKNMLKQESINSIYIENGEESNKNFLKKESIYSYFTLGAKSREKNKGSSKFSGQEKEKNVSKFSKQEKKISKEILNFKEFSKEEKNSNYFDNSIEKTIKNKRTVPLKSNNKKNNNYQISEDKFNNRNDEEEIKKAKKRTFSTTDLKLREEKIMLKNLLVLINDIFKKKIIDSEQKLKIKQLIISKSKKLDYIYIMYYDFNKEKFINELINLIR